MVCPVGAGSLVTSLPRTGLEAGNQRNNIIGSADDCRFSDVVFQTSADATLRSSLSGGTAVQAEGFHRGNRRKISQIAMRVQTNTTETQWFGVNGRTALPTTSANGAVGTLVLFDGGDD